MNLALVDQAMVSGVNFFSGLLFARYLGVEEYGRFALAWMAVLFFNSLQQAGIIAPMMSIGPKQEKDKEAVYYGAVFIQQVIWSVACFFLLWYGVRLSGLLKPEWQAQDLALPLAAALLAWQLQDFLRRYFFVRNQAGLAFLNDAVSYLGQIVLLLTLFQLMALDTALVLYIIAATSTLAVGVGLFSLGPLSVSFSTVLEITKNHWRFSKWMLASALMQWTSGNFFIIGAGGILGPASAGALKASQNIMGVSHIIFQGLENIVPARASYHYYTGGWPRLRAYLKQVTLLGGCCTAGIALLAGAFPVFWLRLFYGDEYSMYGYVLQWYAVIYLLIFLGLPLRAGLRALESSKPIFISYLLMTVFTAATTDFLIGRMGIVGATIGILGTQVICQISLGYALWQKGHSLSP